MKPILIIVAGVPVCNEVERERDPQQQVYYQTIKATASRPSSAKSHSDPAAETPRATGALPPQTTTETR
jgi:hypothetical protein